MQTTFPYLVYKEPDCPLEALLAPLQPLHKVWSINPSARLLTYCQAQHIECANLAAKKQSELWKTLTPNEASTVPDLMVMRVTPPSQPSRLKERHQEVQQTLGVLWKYCHSRQIPLMLDRSELDTGTWPWFLAPLAHAETPKNEDAFTLPVFLEIAAAEPGLTHPERIPMAITGSAGWLEALSHLPAFLHLASSAG
jgi:hypothetical protein